MQGIIYQELPESNLLVLGDRSSPVHTQLDPCGALNLMCSGQLVSDHEMGWRTLLVLKGCNPHYCSLIDLVLISGFFTCDSSFTESPVSNRWYNMSVGHTITLSTSKLGPGYFHPR